MQPEDHVSLLHPAVDVLLTDDAPLKERVAKAWECMRGLWEDECPDGPFEAAHRLATGTSPTQESLQDVARAILGLYLQARER